jgi:predicted nucleic acid-binding protein
MPVPFLDANILLRHLLRDHEEHSPKARAIVGRIERGALRVRISETVVFETVITLERTYDRRKALISEGVQDLLDMPGTELPGKHLFRRVFEL